MAALLSPKTNEANANEGWLNINKISIIIGGGIIRNQNAITLKKNKRYLFCKIKSKSGGRLIAIPLDKTHKKMVSKIALK
tara:strand:+ start:316 stop:555 length:240 start_codon:yes stop_codon:yes gene_type:complete